MEAVLLFDEKDFEA